MFVFRRNIRISFQRGESLIGHCKEQCCGSGMMYRLDSELNIIEKKNSKSSETIPGTHSYKIVFKREAFLMFKKLASDALGLSDIGIVVPRSDFDKTDADDFIFNEKDEQIYFLIKTKADEYCFTNYGLIHVDGANAMSKKRMLRRYDYEHHTIDNVLLETAGTIDLDVEIKFTISNVSMSIDIHKKFLTEIKDLYKALHAISLEQKSNQYKLESAKQSLTLAASALGHAAHNDVSPATSFENITKFSHNWLLQQKDAYVKKDFSDVFEKYINN